MRTRAAFFLCCLLASPVYAGPPNSELKSTEEDLKAARTRDKELNEQSQSLETELATMQKELASTAKDLQTTEQELSGIEEKLVILQSQLDEKTQIIEQRRKEIASMLAALVRLSGTPPEAALMMPGDFEKTLRAARAVESVSASLKNETESLRRQLEELETLKEKVKRGEDAARKKREALAARHAELKVNLSERQKLQAKLHSERTAQASKVAKLAQKAANLKDLVASIESKEAETQTIKPASRSDGKLRSFARAKGKIRMPAAGKLIRNFGVTLSQNETTRGLTWVTPAKTTVLAPYDGEVVYAGTFLNYGKLIILRHSDDYHSLIAGLSALSVRPGQFLLEGEPIGAMGDKNSGDRLYLELRKQNQPIDPAPWIASLKHS